MPGLTEKLRERTSSHPDRIAYIAGDVRISYADFDRRVDRAAAALAGAASAATTGSPSSTRTRSNTPSSSSGPRGSAPSRFR
ncbi:hypothetical protein [Actinomadura sp. CNU-125]|uniref:hypothetical protein n=1 Tax=Actinomadura sp. CNU-125 TaxID=1904961 RepID=UPI0021CCE567|nr:hypothetical protein [Actinomadura sp. CNU-125]